MESITPCEPTQVDTDSEGDGGVGDAAGRIATGTPSSTILLPSADPEENMRLQTADIKTPQHLVALVTAERWFVPLNVVVDSSIIFSFPRYF
jgi:hypothetical protein